MPTLDRVAALGVAAAAALLAREIAGRATEWDLAGRNVLIVGGSRGLALLLARRFAGDGARVAICARDAEELQRARDWLAEAGHDVAAVQCDAGDTNQVRDLVADVQAQLGSIDILVNNAAIMHVGPVTEMTGEDFADAQSAIFWSTLLPTLAILPSMRARGEGRIVNIASIGGRMPGPHLAPYTAAKFAVVGLSETLRAELARDGIKVTTVIPWFMRTGSYFNAVFKEPAEEEFRWFALGSSLPLLSVDADRAAARIVQAAKRGEADVAIGWPAWVAQRFHGLFPGLTADLAGIVNRLLPRPEAGATEGRAVRGEILESRVASRPFETVTAWGRQAADELNERRGPGPAPELEAAIGAENPVAGTPIEDAGAARQASALP